MSFVATPPYVEKLSEARRPEAIYEGHTELSRRLLHSVYVYFALLLGLYFSTDYPVAHPLIFWPCAIVMTGALALRICVIRARARFGLPRRDLWFGLTALTTVLLAGTVGFLLAHSVAAYGFSHWNFAINLVWAAGIAAGSIVSLTPDFRLLVIHMILVISPAFAYTVQMGDAKSRTYAVASLLLCVFIITHGRHLYINYWSGVVHLLLESERSEELHLAKLAAEQASDSARKASQAKSQFLANMSHEIRTPMHGVLGMADLLLATPLQDSQRDDLMTLRESAQNLLRILNDILDLSKVEAGEVHLENIPMAPHQIVHEAVNTLRATAEGKGLLLRTRVLGTPQNVLGDPVRLRQVLLNLTGNAVKFTQYGSVIAEVRFGEPQGDLVPVSFSVADTGPGIPKESQERIFDAFSQSDSSVSRRYGGTGLGLSISSHLVRLMQSRIQVESHPDEGSRFFFDLRFPMAEPSMASVPVAAPVERSTRPLRILLAEDNAVNQKIAHTQLLRLGHSIQLACDGYEAVEACRKEHFDVILMDNQMPNLPGIEAAMAIHDQERALGQALTPIVALTADAMADDRQRFLEAGMLAHLAKPFLLADLANVLAGIEKSALPAAADGPEVKDRQRVTHD